MRQLQPQILRLFGKHVRESRQAKGWSQEKLAEMCGLHRTYIGGIERGERNVSLINVARIAAALGTTPATLLTTDRH